MTLTTGVEETLYAYYSAIVAHEVIGGFFQGDDLGYKTSTIIAPTIIRELVIPLEKSTGLSFLSKKRIATDTAQLSREKREWIEEGKGIIQSWEDFESYPWPKIEQIDFSFLDLLAECIPEGMKVFLTPSSGVFEVASEELLGFEGMSYLLYEDYSLAKAVFGKVGETLYAYYSTIVAHEVIGGFFQGDDLGYKTSTIVAPTIIRELVIPWHKKCASLAHEYGKVFFFHSPGYNKT